MQDKTSLLPSFSIPVEEEEEEEEEEEGEEGEEEEEKAQQEQDDPLGEENQTQEEGKRQPSTTEDSPPPISALPQLPVIEQRWHPCWDTRYRRYYFWDTLTNTTTWKSPVPAPLGLPDDPSSLQAHPPLSASASPPSPTLAGTNQTSLPFRSSQQKKGEKELKSSGSTLGSMASPVAKQTHDASIAGLENWQNTQERESQNEQQRLQERDWNSSTRGMNRAGHPLGDPDVPTNREQSEMRSNSSSDVDAEEFSNADLGDSLRGEREKKKRRLNSNNEMSMTMKHDLREVDDTIGSNKNALPPSSFLLPAPTQQSFHLQTHQPPAYIHQAYHHPPSLGTGSRHPHSLPNIQPSFSNGLANNGASVKAYPSTSPPIYSPVGIKGDVMGNDGPKSGGNGGLTGRGSGGTQFVFPCTHPGCNKTFTRLYNLKSHLRTHTNDRPFQCDECPSAFTRNHDLRRHKKVHSGDKPFCCEGCGRQFGRMDALGRHRINKPECLRLAEDSKKNMPQNEANITHLSSQGLHDQQQTINHSATVSHSAQFHLHQPSSQPQHQSVSVAVGYDDHGLVNKDLHLLQQQLQAQHEQHQQLLQGGREVQQRGPQQQQSEVHRNEDSSRPSPPTASPSNSEPRHFESTESSHVESLGIPILPDLKERDKVYDDGQS